MMFIFNNINDKDKYLWAIVHVHSGSPFDRENKQSRWSTVPGVINSSPESVIPTSPEVTLYTIDGGESTEMIKVRIFMREVFSNKKRKDKNYHQISRG